MFRDMRRKKQELSAEACETVLQRGSYGVLACAGDDGYPYAVPLNYIWHKGVLYFHSANAGHKIDAILREPKASFCVVDKSDLVPEEFTTYFRSVIAFGHARIVADPDEAFDALTALTVGLAHDADEQAMRDELEKCKHRRSLAMIALDVDRLTGKESIELVRGHKRPIEAAQPPEIADRQVYQTRIGPVCMSRTEHAAYMEELRRRNGESID